MEGIKISTEEFSELKKALDDVGEKVQELFIAFVKLKVVQEQINAKMNQPPQNEAAVWKNEKWWSFSD